ncbi:MAG: polysaccharide biosynthesis protein [Firmicutes bacterium]|nr:polysaccharide biosynthesis protein [Bacillota bacterium]
MYGKRKRMMVLADAVIINAAALLTMVLPFNKFPAINLTSSIYLAAILTAVRLLSHWYFGLYNRVWEYASINELISTIKAVTVGSLISIFLLVNILPASHNVYGLELINWFISLVLIGGFRLFLRIREQGYHLVRNPNKGKRVLIVGAGDAGVLVAKEFKNHYQGTVNVIGFIDDDPNKLNMKLLDHDILGTRSDIPQVVSEYRIEEIVIAMPSVSGKTIREIVQICQTTDAAVKILPGVFDIIEGNVTVSQIREVQVEDLLGREPVKVDLESMSDYIRNQVVLVTGAGGSIGSELCRQLVKFDPKVLLLLDISENGIYDVMLDLQEQTNVPLIPLIKDVRDWHGIHRVFHDYKPDVIYHAAAHKHVPLMEYNPEEAIKNNCMGTYNVAQAANIHNAKRFVLVSTDKAVNPTSVMGASKRIAEMLIQYLNSISNTHFVGVRFGNVLGSKGSVVPLFKRQIAAGGPVTVTHEEMVRYFMTIPEAVQLIIQAGAFASDGEIFVLDMGEPVRIMDLAQTLIRLSGFEVEDIGIVITGMRPGEKMYEELLTTEEVRANRTKHERIFIAPPTPVDSEIIMEIIQEFMTDRFPAGPAETEAWIQRLLPDFKLVRHDHKEAYYETATTSES